MLEEGSWAQEVTDHPAFEGQGRIGQEEMHWGRELEPIIGEREEKRWVSTPQSSSLGPGTCYKSLETGKRTLGGKVLSDSASEAWSS
jgi:hypothetical protein